MKWTGEKGREKPEIWQNVRQSHSKCPRMWTDLNPNPQPIFSYYNDINSLLLVKLSFSFLPIQKIVVYSGR